VFLWTRFFPFFLGFCGFPVAIAALVNDSKSTLALNSVPDISVLGFAEALLPDAPIPVDGWLFRGILRIPLTAR
jgi:hypothetical protein